MEEKEIINENQTNNEEVTLPETPNDEEISEQVQVEDVNQEVEESVVIEIEKLNPDEKPYNEIVEEERKAIMAQNKKSSIISTISMFVVVGLSVAGIILLNIVPILSYILMGVAIAALITVMVITKRIARPDVKGYVVKASTAINRFVFNGQAFTDVKSDPTDKLELQDVFSDGAFEGISRVASRNVVEGKYNGRSFKVCETAFFKPGEGKRREAPVFIGKYLSLTNDLHFEGRVVLIKKGEQDTDLPDGLSDIVGIENDEKFFAYAPDEKTYKALNKNFVKAIKEFPVKDHLLNLTVILWAGRTIAYASYDDPTITLPFYEAYQADTAVQYRDNLVELLNAAQLLLEDK